LILFDNAIPNKANSGGRGEGGLIDGDQTSISEKERHGEGKFPNNKKRYKE
jgi:hypothetical protein